MGMIVGALISAQALFTTLPPVLAKDMAGSWMLTIPGKPGGCSLSLETVPGKKSLLVVRRPRCTGAVRASGFDRLGVGRGSMGALTPKGEIFGSFLLRGSGYLLEEGNVRMRLVRVG